MEEGPNIHCMLRSQLGQVVLTHSKVQVAMKAHHSFFRATIHFSTRWRQNLKSGLIFWIKSCVLQRGASWVCARQHRLLRAGQHLKTLNWQRQSEIGAAGESAAPRPTSRSDRCFRRHSLFLFTNKTWYPQFIVAFRQNPNYQVFIDNI